LKYRHLFFDLDGTLWDLRRNTREALQQITSSMPELFNGVGFETFYASYQLRNHEVWELYRQGDIAKEELRVVRFSRALNDCGIPADAKAVERIASAFLDICPRQPHLLPGARELLNHVQGRYDLNIITNGFQEVQGIKMAAAKIGGYFNHIVFSEEAGVRKPHKGIFDLAFSLSGAHPSESLMIGDDWQADIIGARNAGMDQAYLTGTESGTPQDPSLNGATINGTSTYTFDLPSELIPIL